MKKWIVLLQNILKMLKNESCVASPSSLTVWLKQLYKVVQLLWPVEYSANIPPTLAFHNSPCAQQAPTLLDLQL